MLARQGTLAAGLGLALLAPGLAQDSARLESLEAAWRHTTDALAELSGVEERVATGQPGAIDHLRGVTEAPAGSPRDLDALAAELSRDVERLRSELSVALEAPPAPAPEAVDPYLETPVATPRAGVGPLDTSLFARASGVSPAAGTAPLAGAPDAAQPPADANATTPAAVPNGSVPTAPVASADPLSHARAAYLAGDHGLAVALLEPSAGDPEADYWRAKSLERLGRTSEALALYRAVAATDGPLASQAGLDVDFLEWRAGYDDALARIAGGEEPR